MTDVKEIAARLRSMDDRYGGNAQRNAVVRRQARARGGWGCRGRARAIDLFCGLGGWTEGLLAEGYRVVGYDIEAHEYGEERYPAELVLQDVLTLDGAQFKDAALIVASPPCQEFSYMAMPWKRAKQIARALRGQDEFPDGYRGSRTIADLTALFDACFRIQREASEAAGRRIPLVVENVRGAEPWVGRARWSFGSYYLWGDVPALMPHRIGGVKNPGLNWSAHLEPDYRTSGKGACFRDTAARNLEGRKNPGFRFDGSGKSFQSESVNRHVGEGRKHHGDWFRDPDCPSRQGGQSRPRAEGVKRPGLKLPEEGFNVSMARELAPSLKGVKYNRTEDDKRQHLSIARKAASAKIAKIPFALSRHIASVYRPETIWCAKARSRPPNC